MSTPSNRAGSPSYAAVVARGPGTITTLDAGGLEVVSSDNKVDSKSFFPDFPAFPTTPASQTGDPNDSPPLRNITLVSPARKAYLKQQRAAEAAAQALVSMKAKKKRTKASSEQINSSAENTPSKRPRTRAYAASSAVAPAPQAPSHAAANAAVEQHAPFSSKGTQPKEIVTTASSKPAASSVESTPSKRPRTRASIASAAVAPTPQIQSNDPVKAKISAVNEARGLTFEEMYVESDSDGDLTPPPAKRRKTSGKSAKVPAPVNIPAAIAQPAGKSTGKSKQVAPAVNPSAVNPPAVNPPTVNPPAAAAQPTVKTRSKANNAPAPLNIAAANAQPVQGRQQATTRNGKAKKTPEYAVPPDYTGSPTGLGYSRERPEGSDLDRPWSCANMQCDTGMTWISRDKMGRKTISQYFGRNKSATKSIPHDVWHYYCRKDYQRLKYAADRDGAARLAAQNVENLRHQLLRLKLWRPQALFMVQLDKAAANRINKYFGLLRKHEGDEAAAIADMPAPVNPNNPKPEEAFPMPLAEHFNTHFRTEGFTATYDDLEAIVAWCEAEVQANNTDVFVPGEFLINPAQDGELIGDLPNNYGMWLNAMRAAAAAPAARAAAPGLILPANGAAAIDPMAPLRAAYDFAVQTGYDARDGDDDDE